jgi:hypothetical protein
MRLGVQMVHAMISRIHAAGFVAMLCLGLVLAPDEAFARGGFGGRSFAFSPGFHPSALRTPFLAHRRFGFERLRRHDGLGVPLTVLGGVGYGPSDHVDPYFQPTDAEPDIVTGAIPGGGNPVFLYRRGCLTQTVTVPSESGGKRAINIVRCY